MPTTENNNHISVKEDAEYHTESTEYVLITSTTEANKKRDVAIFDIMGT